MSVTAIYANLSCRNLERSVAWFTGIFGAGPDARPMAGLAEWHLGTATGLQVHEDADKAGKGTATLFVHDLDSEKQRLGDLAPGDIERGGAVPILRLSDPDGNLVVLVDTRSA